MGDERVLCDILYIIIITKSPITEPTMSSTQVRTRSSNTEEIPMEECMAVIDQYSKRRSRKISKPAGAEKVPTPVGAQSTPKPGANPGADVFQFGEPISEVNPAAVDVWDQLFRNTDFIRLAGNREFFHQRVLKALSPC